MFKIEGIIANTGQRKRIEIDSTTGLITKVAEPTGVADVLLQDELIFPGFIDLHVHAREDTGHTQDYKEDFTTAGQAAINGGIVAFVEMPNNPVPPIDDASYEAKNNLSQKSPVSVLLYAGIGPKTKPLSKKVPYKVFMGKSVGELFFTSLNELEATLKNYTGEYISFHCENPEILEKYKDALTHELRRPAEAEISGVEFALNLIKKYNLRGKICHVSTKDGINKILEAKKEGIDVKVEVTPHHLYFSKPEKMLQVNPPIRSEEDCLRLLELLKTGQVDFLATDHAPHTMEEKENGVSGMPHLDTYGPFVSWLMQEHNFLPSEISRVCSQNPAEFLSNFTKEKYGEIKEGYVGSLTILDLHKQITINKEMLKTKSQWSPFEGVTFPGRVAATVVKGKLYDQK